MKRFLCCLILLSIIVSVNAQKVYFVYLQTETEQPFFVKLNDKVFSSASSGYLILSKLRDSSYTIKVGFPQNKWPEQQFIINVRATDHGYVLKNFGDKGWGLFDLQTLAVQMAVDASKTGAFRTEPKQVSEFTEVLSKAANDPSLMMRTIAVKMPEKDMEVQSALVKENVIEQKPPAMDSNVAAGSMKAVEKLEVKTSPVNDSSLAATTIKKKDSADAITILPVVVQKDSSSVVRIEATVKPDSMQGAGTLYKELPQKKEDMAPVSTLNQAKEEPKTIQSPSYPQSKVSKKSESSTTEGLGIVFMDNYSNGVRDTVRILIPNPRTIAKIENTAPPIASSDKKMLDVAAEKNKEESKEIKRETAKAPNNSSDKSARGNAAPANPGLPGNCKVLASEKDYVKLRKKMVAAKTEQDMLEEGKKNFEERCYNTEQIKGLGSLFLQEAVKYQFYEVAYAHNTDRDNFLLLEAEFKDPYFIHRFQNLVK